MAAHLKSKRKRDVNLAKLDEPLMITLTELPANRTGFRTVRSAAALAQEDGTMIDVQKRTRTRSGKTVAPKATPKVKISRIDAGLLTLVLPEGATEDDAATVIEQFGLADDYTIRSEDGFISLVRKTEEGETLPGGVEVALAKGITATVDYAMFPDAVARADKAEADAPTGVAVARMDFSIAHFETLEAVRDYLTKNEIDYLKDGVEQVEGGVIVHRVDPNEYDGKGKQIEIAPGVLAHVTRGEADSIPVAIRRAVTDAAFGSFGMGHLDFSAALVDPEVSSQAGNAIFQLTDVLDNIVFRSGLPLDDRKDLIVKATADFSGFMGGLMDAVGDMGFASTERGDKPVDRTTEDAASTETPAPEATARTDEGEGTDTPAKDASTDDGTAAEAAARTDTDAGGEAKDTHPAADADSAADVVKVATPAVGISRKDLENTVKVALEAAGATFGDALKEIVKGNELTTKRLDVALKSLRTEVEKIGDTTNVARDNRDDENVDAGVGGDHDGDSGDSADVFRGAFGSNFPGNSRRAV